MKNLFLFFVLLTMFSLRAAYWIPQHPMPYEMESLVKSIEWNHLELELKKSLESNLGKVDFMMGKIPDKDLYFLIKMMIYKFLIRHSPSYEIPKNFYESRPFLNFEMQKGKRELIPFGKWLLAAILSDLEKIHRSPEYQKYLQWRKTASSTTAQIKQIEKRLHFVIPWFLFFQTQNTEEANWSLQPTLHRILFHLGEHLKIYWELNHSKKLAWPSRFEISRFALREEEVKKPRDHFLEGVDDAVKKYQLKNLPKPVDDWIVKNSDFASERTPLRKNQDPDPNYKPPSTLPQPVDDWATGD